MQSLQKPVIRFLVPSRSFDLFILSQQDIMHTVLALACITQVCFCESFNLQNEEQTIRQLEELYADLKISTGHACAVYKTTLLLILCAS